MKYYLTQQGRELLGEEGDPFDVEANERKLKVARAVARQKHHLKQTRLARKRGVKPSTRVPRRDR